MKPRPSPQGGPEALIELTAGFVRGTGVSRDASLGAFVVITTVIDSAAGAVAHPSETGCSPVTCRIGLLGLGDIGSAFARLAREAAPHLYTRGFAPLISTALVRSLTRPRPAASLVNALTD